MMRQSYGNNILDHFQIDEVKFLGSGGESRVYALDGERVLRVFSPGTILAKVQTLRDFYRSLDTEELDFQTPTISEMGSINDTYYSIEPRIPGSNLTNVLTNLSGEARELAIGNYIKAAAEVHRIPFTADCYGEFLVDQPLQSQEWCTFLEHRADVTLNYSEEYLSADVPNLGATIDRWHREIREVASPTKNLVHGDFFPGNVIAQETGAITGVIDFSPMTVVGDWKMDLAGAVIFLEVICSYKIEDSKIAKSNVDKLLGGDSTKLIELYRLYYSLYFSAAKDDDPELYSWCVQNLRQAAEAAN